MNSEDEQDAETARMAPAAVENEDSANVKQDTKAEVPAWVWRRIGRCCKEWSKSCCAKCLLFRVVLIIIIIIALGVTCGISYQGKCPSEYCPSEWIGYKNKCYFISEKEHNWTSSQTFCAKNDSSLAVFKTEKEMHSLAKRLKIDDSWIGLRKKGESFYWVDGVELKVDMFQIQNHSECAYFVDGTISTSACSLPRRWICVRFPKEMT